MSHQEFEDYIIYNCEQTSPEWFELRKGKITGSKFGDILYQKFNNHEEVAKSIKGESEKDFTEEQKENMRNGIIEEPNARILYEKENNVTVKQVGILISKIYDFLGFSPDGLVGEDGMIEIKCPKKIYTILSKYNKIWGSHYAQIQGGLFLFGRKWCDYVVYGYEEKEIMTKRIYFNKKFCENTLLPSLIKFNEEYLK